jgi:uncharacterized protein (DUF433 family)
METLQAINIVATNPLVRSGRPYIVGTTIEVSALVIAHIVQQQSAEDIANDYRLSLAQVYAAFAYYYEHRAEMDVLMRERDALAKQLKEQLLGSRA